MFVTSRKHEALKERYDRLLDIAHHLDEKLDSANYVISALKSRLRSLDGIKAPKPKGFTKDKLKQLRALVHPDKHKGSQVAIDLFILINKTLNE